ncbi:vWA domain-containing protein [Psychroflexus planctonicus]|uniref:vWA domain-containing protein n=1 Tax=Psychroflexus planctonicus TaxID=1526575 RepID=UPI001664A4FD|nr:vWA domain-containing protein [Psychroflexus planctonicus]
MTNQSILLLILIVCLSLGLSYFQYLFSTKKRSQSSLLFFALRFFTYLTLGILLLNPKIENTTTQVIKRNLIFLVDNSSSINQIGDSNQVEDYLKSVSTDEAIQEKFNIEKYKFGEAFTELDSLDFSEKQTKITDALSSVHKIYDTEKDAVVLISDGNQSMGADYSLYSKQKNLSIFPVLVGDTIPAFDAKIDLVNANNYSFLNNQFPVEVFVSYNGIDSEETKIKLLQNQQEIASKKITFETDKASQQIQFQVEANQIGLQLYDVVLETLEGEKFTDNNQYQFGVEVIDERAKILLATSILHPDVGMWKRSIETKKQREVEVKFIGKDEVDIDDYQMVIFYQPKSNFKSLLDQTSEKGLGSFTITGTQTDYALLNKTQDYFNKEVTSSTEEYYSSYHSNFSSFQFEDIGFSEFPPLQDVFGEVFFEDEYKTLLFQNVQNITTETPLLFTYSENSTNHAVLLGENSWRWRSQFYASNESFEDFDAFVSSLIQYLSSSDYKQRLLVNASNFYNEGEKTQLSAKFYDANYNLLPDADLSIQITDEASKETQRFPMLFVNNKFVFNTASLSAGNYSFKITEKETQTSKEGQFKIVAYNVENQFINPNLSALKAIGESEEIFNLSTPDQLKNQLLEANKLQPIQKKVKKNQSLIDWPFLLGFLALTLFFEWFIRKYKGLI